MSKQANPTDRRAEPESGFEALRRSPEFRGPVEPLDDPDHANDHLAVVYETREELFAAVVPFVRQGLDRGERCVYVVDDPAEEEEVIEELRSGGVDVEDALESGALAFYTAEETYLRNEPFDPEEMISFYADAVEEASEEYDGFRVTAGTNWIDEVSLEDFMEYEGRINRFFEETDSMALCHYDRTRLPREVIRDVVRTHPHLVYDGTVCHNFYYTPPEELYGSGEPDDEVDRLLGTVRDRAQAKTEVAEHKRFLRELNEITADPDRSFEEKLHDLFDLGCERFDLDLGALNRVSLEEDRLEVEHINGHHEYYEPGAEFPLSQTYCVAAADIKAAASVSDPPGEGFDDLAVYQEFGVEGYLGTYLPIEGGDDRTFAFIATGSRAEPFSREDRTYLELMGQWVKYELERKRREDRLAGLNALSRELMEAETATEVCDSVADAADGALDLPVTAIALYDERDGVLRPGAATDSAGDLLQATSPLAVGDGIGWNAFVENDRRRETDPQSDRSGDVRPSLTELVALPLGNHGVMLTGTTASGGFGSTDLDLVEAVTGSLTAALDRADREQQLQEREATLAEQNESLERLSRVNDIIRSIDQALLRASTRAEIEAVVCEQLSDHGAYELAWIGEHDPVTGEITPQQSAGAEKGYLDRVTMTANDRPDGRGPTGRAVRTREPQVVNDILEDGSYEPWRQAALKRGFHASVALPLVYEDSFYGVLNVYAGRPNVFDDLERAVLAELGETIAHAINAVESKKALVSDEITELEFTTTDEEVDLVALSVRTDCEVSLESVVPRSDGRLRAFFSARGATPAEVREFAPRLAASDVDLVTEHEEDGETVGLYEALLTDESLFAAMVDHGGMPWDVTVVDGTARVVVGLAAAAATKEFVETVTTKYPDSELVAQRTRERPRKTGTEHRAALTSDLTDRQLEVFQTAYFSGYFDKPRARTGTEIAASLDISQPTFNHHVRAAQRKLCRQLFEGEVP